MSQSEYLIWHNALVAYMTNPLTVVHNSMAGGVSYKSEYKDNTGNINTIMEVDGLNRPSGTGIKTARRHPQHGAGSPSIELFVDILKACE
ncbi:MAG: hypothetical protein HYS98_07035 [Deltaproteobacteria bacterium]|nr:hypothetical protein [Deltaproteobacteria bacterium]